ncbi:MAG TPA: T9SS type A sorting domain-containing protein [Bacteroidia bacterium]|nr:T9SS type A sorting domain-containing protein [Bacteroidia bacterium]
MKKTITILAAACCLNINAQTVCFSPATSFTVGTQPTSVISTDFNGDGKKDLAVANYGTNNVSVLLGTGTGSFGAPANFAVGVSPNSICSTDFNGDGKADLATANISTNNVSVLLGTGTGSFGAASNFLVGGSFDNPVSLTSADFNGDGKKDLAVVVLPQTGNGKVGIFLGTGTGSFSAITNFLVAGTQPDIVTSADFNGDGKADLAVANADINKVSVLLGTGTGSFGAPANFVVGTTPTSMINADFNGDGKVDLATANSASNSVSILLGTGTGSFGTATNYTVGTGTFSSIINADFNGDTKLDLAVTDYSAQNVGVLLGTGTGSFGAATSFTVGASPTFVTSADLNGDTKPDLVTANRYSNNTAVLLNCTVTGITSYIDEQEIKIYPNPNNGIFIIEASSLEVQSVQLFDLNGKLILSQASHGKTTIDATNLNEGIYSLKVQTADGTVNKKLVIVK